MTRSKKRPRVIKRSADNANLERKARIWEKGVVANWEAQLMPSLLGAMSLPSEGSVLVAECRTGSVPVMLAQRLSDSVRCIAIDPSREMLDLARVKYADEEQIWWEARPTHKMPYKNGVFGATVCAAGVISKDDLHRVAGQLSRVTRPGGEVGMLVPLARSLSTFYDLFREALIAEGLEQYEPALDAYIDNLLDEDALRVDLAAAGIRDVTIETHVLPMTFETGTDFLTSPLVDLVYMPTWTRIIEDEEKGGQVFDSVINALDTYFCGVDMTVKVRAASLRGQTVA